MVFKAKSILLDKPERFFVYSYLTYTAYNAFNMLWHGNWQWSTFNYPVKFTLVLGLYLLIRRYGYSNKSFLIGAIAGTVGSLIWACYQAEFLSILRVFGSTNKFISAFGLIAIFTGFSALYQLQSSSINTQLKRAMFILIAAATTYNVIKTGTKGVWITFPALALCWLLAMKSVSRRHIFYVAALGIIAPLLLYTFSSTFNHRIGSIIEPILIYIDTGIPTDGSATIRLETWKATWLMYQENMLFGVGIDNFLAVKAKLIELGYIHPMAKHPAGPHNDLIGALGTLGTFGFVFTVLLFVSFFTLIHRYRNTDRQAYAVGLALIAVIAISGLTGDRLQGNLTATFFAVMSAIIAGKSSFENQKRQS